MLLKVNDELTEMLGEVFGGITIHDQSGRILGRVQSYDTKTREIEIILSTVDLEGELVTVTKADGDQIAKVKTILPGSYACFGGKRWYEEDPAADNFWREKSKGVHGCIYPHHPTILGERPRQKVFLKRSQSPASVRG